MINTDNLFLELFNSLIDHTIIISLKRCTKRRERCVKQLNIYSILNYTFFDAIDLTDNIIEENELYEKYLNNNVNKGYILNKGEMGCILSHLHVMKIAKNMRYKTILILEDDFLLSKSFHEKFIELINNIPDSWDLIYLGKKHQHNKNKKIGVINNINNIIYKPNSMTQGSHALLINNSKDIFDELIKLYTRNENPVDHELRKLFKNYNCFSVNDDLIITSLDDSTIRSEIEDYSIWGWDKSKYFDDY